MMAEDINIYKAHEFQYLFNSILRQLIKEQLLLYSTVSNDKRDQSNLIPSAFDRSANETTQKFNDREQESVCKTHMKETNMS